MMELEILKKTAQELLAPGKGILAADESTGTCTKRFDAVGMLSTEENRRSYREILITTPGIEEYLSGIILVDETIRQKTLAGIPFTKVLMDRGIIPGIKVDKGLVPFPFFAGEKISEGLDGLAGRLEEYKALGARFAKFRTVTAIGGGLPTEASIRANAHLLARYAALCQDASIVPVVEPEVLIDGDHDLNESYVATRRMLKAMFTELTEFRVVPEGVILKTSMVLSGEKSLHRATPEEVAEATVRCLNECVPAEVAGVVFLSGGQTEEEATANLNMINRQSDRRWRLTFSYSRAIQNPVLALWAKSKIDEAKQAYLFRVRSSALASEGKYGAASETLRPYTL